MVHAGPWVPILYKARTTLHSTLLISQFCFNPSLMGPYEHLLLYLFDSHTRHTFAGLLLKAFWSQEARSLSGLALLEWAGTKCPQCRSPTGPQV